MRRVLLVLTLLTVAVILLRLPVSPFIPAGGALLAALGAAWLAHREVLTKAAAARSEFRRAMCTYLDLAERVQPSLMGAEKGLWLDRLAAEHDNLRAAHAWVIETGRVDT